MSDSEDSEDYNIYDSLDIQYDLKYDHLGTNEIEYEEKFYNLYDCFFNHIPDENIIFHIYDNLSFLSLSKLSTTSKYFYNHINTYLNDQTIKNKILFSYKNILYDKHYYNKFPLYNIIIDHYISNKYNHNLFKELLNVNTKEKINIWSKQLRINNYKYKDKNISFIQKRRRIICPRNTNLNLLDLVDQYSYYNMNNWVKLIIRLL